MGFIRKRIAQSSSFAGYGLALNAGAKLIVNPADLFAWGELLAGVAAILKDEAQNVRNP